MRAMTKQFQFCLYFGVLTIMLGCVGILGNLLSILVLQTRRMKSCFNNLLTALNISDRYQIVHSLYLTPSSSAYT